MSSISYIQQQLRNLGDYTGDGKILSAVDIQKATEYKNNNTINPIIYNKVLEYYNRYVLYTITKQKNGSDPTIIAQGNLFDKLKNDAAQLKSDNLLAVDCNLTQGCKGISVIEGSDSIEGSGLDNKFLKIINVRQPDDKYKIYFLGNEIVELLVEFELNDNDLNITYSDKFNKIFENLITSDNPEITIPKDLKAVKQYDNKLYVARLSNIDKNTFGRYKDMANSDSDWNLQEVQEPENHLLLESNSPITNINKIRFGSNNYDELLGLLDSDTIDPDYISTETPEITDLQ